MSPSGSTGERERVPVRFDRYRAVVDAPVALAPAVRSLFADQLLDDVPETVPIVHVDVKPNRLSIDGRAWKPGGIESVLDELLYMILQGSLEADAGRLHLHAGLVVHRGRSILVGGTSGSGKSTLIAQLVERGLDYGTDERVAVDRSGAMSVFEKPISVTSRSFPLLRSVDPRVTGRGAASDRLWHIPSSAIRSGSQCSNVRPLGAVVLVEHRADTELMSELMHPVTVARVLLSDCLDADRFGADGPEVVTRLCASVPCFSMVYPGGASAADDFVRLVDGYVAAGHAPSAVESVAGSARAVRAGASPMAASSVLGIASGVTGVLAGDRALLRTATGALVELDEAQSAWLQLLDGNTSLGSLVDEIAHENGLDPVALLPSVINVVENLSQLGVVG